LYAYEARNLRIRETYPDNGERQYTYDAANRLSSRLDQANDLTQYVYDMANRLTQRLYPDALNDLFGYDRANRLVSAASQRYANTVTRAYDNAGRLISETLAVAADGDGGPFSATIAYDYDAANRQTQVSYPDGSVVSRAFSARNQLAQVNYQANLVASLAYDVGRRRVTTTFGNGRVETRTYRPDNLPTTQKTPGVTDFTYSWDANKRKTQELDAAIPQNAQDYAYDAEDRLLDFAGANGDAQTWNLTLEGDWAGTIINGLTENRTHNAVHELIQRNGTTLTYDAKGNLTSNPSRGHTYAWDYENRLISVSSALSVVEMSYDALGRRVSKTDGAATTIFVSAGLQEIAEYTNNALTKKYVYGVYIDEPLLMINVAGLVETKYYYHANNLYSVAAITDATGAVVERYRYTPYGEATVLDPTGLIPQPSSLVSQPYFFTGRRLDAETDLMYYRARYYDVQLGRFLSRDPLEYVDGMNLYMYVGNSPPNLVDPTGRAAPAVIAAACAISCGCCLACVGDAVWTCYDQSDTGDEFTECLKNYIDGLPITGKVICASGCTVCAVCVVRWVVTKAKQKPLPPPPPVPPKVRKVCTTIIDDVGPGGRRFCQYLCPDLKIVTRFGGQCEENPIVVDEDGGD
jgi:RHS repeat-associated protein